MAKANNRKTLVKSYQRRLRKRAASLSNDRFTDMTKQPVTLKEFLFPSVESRSVGRLLFYDKPRYTDGVLANFGMMAAEIGSRLYFCNDPYINGFLGYCWHRGLIGGAGFFGLLNWFHFGKFRLMSQPHFYYGMGSNTSRLHFGLKGTR